MSSERLNDTPTSPSSERTACLNEVRDRACSAIHKPGILEALCVYVLHIGTVVARLEILSLFQLESVWSEGKREACEETTRVA